VTISETPPSDSMVTSARRSGSTMYGMARYCSIDIGSRNSATGFFRAHSRSDTAIMPNCSSVVPYTALCRCSAIAAGPAMCISPDAPARVGEEAPNGNRMLRALAP
jgi:hypothetical protein